jgi:hypothetical protein
MTGALALETTTKHMDWDYGRKGKYRRIDDDTSLGVRSHRRRGWRPSPVCFEVLPLSGRLRIDHGQAAMVDSRNLEAPPTTSRTERKARVSARRR